MTCPQGYYCFENEEPEAEDWYDLYGNSHGKALGCFDYYCQERKYKGKDAVEGVKNGKSFMQIASCYSGNKVALPTCALETSMTGYSHEFKSCDPGKVCSNGKCVTSYSYEPTPEVNCSDSDKSNDPSIPGMVNSKIDGSHSDYCTGQTLHHVDCGPNDEVVEQTMTCPVTCSGGKCE